MNNYTDPNDYTGSDIERINAAIRDAAGQGGIVRIFERKPDAVSLRKHWLIDSAILLPENTVLYLMNCRIKLSDQARDNWIRSANCLNDQLNVEELSGIHIIGEGNAVLEGADHPRATGDSGKTLGKMTYGTDAGKKGELQKGDWRNLGILLVKVRDFSIRNLTLKDSHCWAVSLEYCRKGLIRDLHFESMGKKRIDGKEETILNQDGLDLRRGCRDITIENITGYTGDDLIALTAIQGKNPAPVPRTSTQFYLKNPPLEESHTFNISIRNVRGYCPGGHHIVRFLNNGGVKLHHIQLAGVMDTSPSGCRARAAVKIGDPNYGGPSPLGDTSDFQISDIHSKALNAILIGGSLCDSMISNVLNYEPSNKGIVLQQGNEKTSGLFLNNIQTVSETASARHGVIVLTFDDGRYQEWLPQMELFKKYNARATFFYSGTITKDAADSMRVLRENGHSIGLHSLSHKDCMPDTDMSRYFEEQIKPQLDAAENFGIRNIRYFAYPNNRHTQESDRFLGKYFARFRAGAGINKPKGWRIADEETVFISLNELTDSKVMGGCGIGEYYCSTLENLDAALTKAANENKLIVFFSHGISTKATGVDMPVETLEHLLKKAAELQMKVIGFNELPE